MAVARCVRPSVRPSAVAATAAAAVRSARVQLQEWEEENAKRAGTELYCSEMSELASEYEEEADAL